MRFNIIPVGDNMNDATMPDWMKAIKDAQDAASTKETNDKHQEALTQSLIQTEAKNVWREFIRELDIQVDLCQKLRGIARASIEPTRSPEKNGNEYRLSIVGGGPLAVTRICVLRFCESKVVAPYIHCLCQDWIREDFRIEFCVDSKTNSVKLLTNEMATPREAASYVIAPIVRVFAGMAP